MKKALSIVITFCVVFMTSINAFAAQAPSSADVKKQIEGAVAYLANGASAYGVDQAMDFCIFADSGADVSKYSDGFVADVKANLQANNGKIVSSYGENLATYGAVIVALQALGEDTADFYGYNIESAFMAMDPTVMPITPNYYVTIIKGASLCNNSDAFLKALCDAYVGKFYTMGKGVGFYGYSCDNTAYFAAAISYGYYQLGEYGDVLKDALAVIETYAVNGGYCYNPEYGVEPNADSVGLALLAYSSYYIGMDESSADAGEIAAKLNSIYNNLCAFESEKTGIFKYADDESPYSTRDALIGLAPYYLVVLSQVISDAPSNENPTAPTVPSAPAASNPSSTPSAENSTQAAAKTNTSKKSPATGANTAVFSATAALLATAVLLTVPITASAKRKSR